MALTQGAWTSKTVNDKLVIQCDVVQTVAEEYSATLKTPDTLDTSKPFRLYVNTEAATIDGAATAVDVYAGYSDDFALSVTTSTLTVTDGALAAADVIDDIKSTCLSVLIDPNYTGTKVQTTLAGVGGVVNCGPAPYFGFVLDATGTLTAGTCRFVIVQ